MKKIILGKPAIVAQSTTEPVLFGGYQDPAIRRAQDGTLYVRFNARRDSWLTFGEEEKNPVYRSADGGESWSVVKNGQDEWMRAGTRLPNGDIFYFREHPVLRKETLPPLPPLPDNRKLRTAGMSVYTVDELKPVLGDRVAKEFKAYRIKAGSDEIIEETCPVIWDNMPAVLHHDGFLIRVFPHVSLSMKIDSEGTLWMPMDAPAIDGNGNLASLRRCTALLKSTDMGHTWEYVSHILYEEKFNPPTAIDVEGFMECSLEFVEDGSCVAFLRSGSLSPFVIGDDDHPAPIMMQTRSYDGCKTWETPKYFYDYGVLPVTRKLEDGTILLSSGRPGVYLRVSQDRLGKEWSDIVPVVDVPKEDTYAKYYEYSCCNTGLAVTGANTAVIAYSDFTLTAPDGKRAKSIMVRKITVTDIE
ncbi:MAG: exo-alpha-sialidase [Clostridia bacterium]|nr:exo-alpha-sialidase [Clostridia bacterium]